MAIAYISHPSCLLHDMGSFHPEQPARLSAINDRMIATGLDMALLHHDAPRATIKQLQGAHTAAHVNAIHDLAPSEGTAQIDGDTSMNSHSLEAALRAAGAAVLATDLVMSGQRGQAFCAVRPPGHHAEHERAMGFCLFNNIAVAAYHALGQHQLERVAIVDFDVHHGNGTEDIVRDDERILFCSTFQHPFYPHSGHDSTAANLVNVPLPAGSGSEAFRAAVDEHWLPRLEAFAPELILVSAGFDAHQGDPLANMNLVDDDFAWVTRRICEQAQRSAQGRIVSSLEGGYDLHALARSVEAHLKAFLGE